MLGMRLLLAARQILSVRRHRDTVPAPFALAISASEHSKAADYTAARLQVGRVDLVIDAAMLLILTLGGGLATLDRLVAGWALSPIAHGVVTLLALMLLMTLVGLPTDLWRTFGVEARYGFNRMTPVLYLTDALRSSLLTVVLGGPLIALILLLMRASGPLWWLYAWASWTVFGLSVAFFFPRFIAPLFNKFRPLEAGPLLDAVVRVMTRCGYAADGVSVMDGSRRSSHGNAYFTGFGAHKRIVLFDTLIERLHPEEVEAVLAHELGHFRLHHIVRRLVLSFASAFVGFAALGYAATRPEWFAAFGVPAPTAHAMLALFLLVVPVFLFPFSPLSGWLSRRDEYAADRFAAAHAEASDLATALVKLYRDNASTLTPDSWYSAWNDSHPPALARIQALTGPTS
ncbi:MAG: M48 family metallopeptidase [Pseudomonadota bacterium]|jgi:STE24 endopeptidase